MSTPSNNTPPRPPSNPNPLTSPPTLLPSQPQPQPQQQQQLQQQQPPPQPPPSSPFQGLFRSPLHSQSPGGHLQPPRGPSPFLVQPPSSPAPNPKRVPQKPPPRPPPPSSSSSPSPSSFKSSELTPASARRKKPKLPDKRLPDRVAALLPESPLYTQLLEFESRVDAALARKKTDIQEALKCPPSMQRTLRIYIFNTSSNQSTPKSPSSEPPSWTLRIIGRILEDTIPETNNNNLDPHPMFPKFSFFLKRLTISLDPTLYPENPTIVWENSRAAVPQEGFEVRRIGDKEFTVGIRLEMNYNPEKFKLSPALVELLGIEVESRARIIAAIWHYVKARKLQNPSDPSFFACDPVLKKVFGEDRMKFALVSQKISQHLSRPPPIQLEHRVRLSGGAAGPLGTACYDVLVDVPFSLQKEMSAFLANTEKHKEIEACDEVILASIKKIHEHRRRRAFFLGFSQSPVEFINALIASQTRDLKVVAGEASRNAEKERRSDFYNQPWVEDAVIRYLNRKPAPGTDAPGST